MLVEIFFHTSLHSTPPLGGGIGTLTSRLVRENKNGGATWWWKKLWGCFNLFGSIPACDSGTDIHLATAYSPRYAYASRDEKLWQDVKPFSFNTGALRTDDRQTDRIPISISRLSLLTRHNKNLDIANRSRVRSARNMSRASMITPWPWYLG